MASRNFLENLPILAVESHFYHVMSRAIEGRMIFDEVAKDCFAAAADVQQREA